MRKGKFVLIGLLLSIAAVGCGPQQARYMTENSLETDEKVVFLDNRLGNDLRIENIRGVKLETGRLVVKMTVMNLKDKPIECRVKYKFKGADGFVKDETNWMPTVFDRREVTHLEQKSLSNKAEDFTVIIRYEKELKGF